MSKKRIILLSACALAILLVALIIIGNVTVGVSRHTVKSEQIPHPFSGFKIAQVSDLHNEEFGKNNSRLLNILRDLEPDIIAITGDIIDSHNLKPEIALDFAKEAVKIAPTYFSAGNHESRLEDYESFFEDLESVGVNVLHNEKAEIEINGEKITLMGVYDPAFMDGSGLSDKRIVSDKIRYLDAKNTSYTVLLSHRPEVFSIYEQYGMELVLSGHAHGGQFRIPVIGGIFAPDQGFFPEYDAGRYEGSHTVMIVSRGLGNSAFPFRINNRPEIVLITLEN